jgi:hypothetical protein
MTDSTARLRQDYRSAFVGYLSRRGEMACLADSGQRTYRVQPGMEEWSTTL